MIKCPYCGNIVNTEDKLPYLCGRCHYVFYSENEKVSKNIQIITHLDEYYICSHSSMDTTEKKYRLLSIIHRGLNEFSKYIRDLICIYQFYRDNSKDTENILNEIYEIPNKYNYSLSCEDLILYAELYRQAGNFEKSEQVLSTLKSKLSLERDKLDIIEEKMRMEIEYIEEEKTKGFII